MKYSGTAGHCVLLFSTGAHRSLPGGPFNNKTTGTPVIDIARTIEINFLQLLQAPDVSEPLAPEAFSFRSYPCKRLIMNLSFFTVDLACTSTTHRSEVFGPVSKPRDSKPATNPSLLNWLTRKHALPIILITPTRMPTLKYRSFYNEHVLSTTI